MSIHSKYKLLNGYRVLKPSSDNLINQTSYKHVRGVIYLVLLINNRYQQGCWPHNLFVHRLNCTLAYTWLLSHYCVN